MHPVNRIAALGVLVVLSACAGQAGRPQPPVAPPDAPKVAWELQTLRFASSASGLAVDRPGVFLAPGLIATSLDVRGYPERMDAMHLVRDGRPSRPISHAISGNAVDLDAALMQVHEATSWAVDRSPVAVARLCDRQPEEGDRLVAIDLTGERRAVEAGPEDPPGSYMRRIRTSGGIPTSGAPILDGACLAGIHVRGRMVQAMGLRHLLERVEKVGRVQ